jgi:antitoxin component of MazEF toxin-antitoxin module
MSKPIPRARWVFRWTARLRREGGSLSFTIPRNLVRGLRLEAGDEMVVGREDDGILMRPKVPRPIARDAY